MQQMLLEQQNNRRLAQARAEENRELELRNGRSPGPTVPKSSAPTGDKREPASAPRWTHDSSVRAEDEQFSNGRDDFLPTDEVQVLRDQMMRLEAKLCQYKAMNETTCPSYKEIYRLYPKAADGEVDENYELEETKSPRLFSDPPEIVYDHDGNGHLRCNLPLRSLDLYLAQNPDISFLVFRDYGYDDQYGPKLSGDGLGIPFPSSESVYPVASGLKNALWELFCGNSAFREVENSFTKTGEIMAPYIFLYHSRDLLDEIRDRLNRFDQEELVLFLSYLQQGFGEEYRIVDQLLEEGKITTKYLSYLFKPGDTLVGRTGKKYVGYVAESWMIDRAGLEPSMELNDIVQPANDPSGHRGNQSPIARNPVFMRKNKAKVMRAKLKPKSPPMKTLKVWTLSFDGEFRRDYKTLTVKFGQDESSGVGDGWEGEDFEEESLNEPHPISSLNVFPLQYAPESVTTLLKKRGQTFWKCHTRKLVSYHGERMGEGVDMVSQYPLSPSFLFVA